MIAIGLIRLGAVISLVVLLAYALGGGLIIIWRTRRQFPPTKKFKGPK